MLAPPDRFTFAFNEALAMAVSAIDTVDESEAAAAVADAVRQAQAAGEQALVTACLVEAKGRARDVEREAAREKADADRRKAIERDGRKAVRKIFGARLGDKVSLFQTYQPVTVHDVTIALATDQLEEFRATLMRELATRPEEGKSAVGYQLGRAVEPAELDAVVADAAQAVELCRAAHGRALEQSAADRQRRLDENAAIRRDGADRSLYGTSLNA